MDPQHKLLIYNCDSAIRKAYAAYLSRNGIPSDSCGTLPEMLRLMSWYAYEFILINIDNLQQDRELSTMEAQLEEVIIRHQPESTLIVTSNDPLTEESDWQDFWFLQEPLTPKLVLTTISRVRSEQQLAAAPKGYLKLRRHLSKPIAPQG